MIHSWPNLNLNLAGSGGQRHARRVGHEGSTSVDPGRSIRKKRAWREGCTQAANPSRQSRTRSALAGQLCIACSPRRRAAATGPLDVQDMPLTAT